MRRKIRTIYIYYWEIEIWPIGRKLTLDGAGHFKSSNLKEIQFILQGAYVQQRAPSIPSLWQLEGIVGSEKEGRFCHIWVATGGGFLSTVCSASIVTRFDS